MKKDHFFNTIALQGEELKKAVTDAKNQEDAIYLIFFSTPERKYAASDITRLTNKAGRNWPVWSNRRAITNLKNRELLSKLDELRDGPMGKPEHLYQLNQSKNAKE